MFFAFFLIRQLDSRLGRVRDKRTLHSQLFIWVRIRCKWRLRRCHAFRLPSWNKGSQWSFRFLISTVTAARAIGNNLQERGDRLVGWIVGWKNCGRRSSPILALIPFFIEIRVGNETFEFIPHWQDIGLGAFCSSPAALPLRIAEVPFDGFESVLLKGGRDLNPIAARH
jgi:hypothetical protein